MTREAVATQGKTHPGHERGGSGRAGAISSARALQGSDAGAGEPRPPADERETHPVAELLVRGTLLLAGATESARLDAELLLASLLGVSRAGLVSRSDHPVARALENEYLALIERRRQGAPVAYLTGTREFWSLPLTVSPAVLVPRPETELLVELALAVMPRDAACAALDLGTGSGAIALALAGERPAAAITAVDVSAEALEVARANARRLGLGHIEWREASWFDGMEGRFDVIVSNPPYIAADDAALAALGAEPRIALTPGPTGLEALTAIVGAAPRHLAPGGWLLLEHGDTQDGAVRALLHDRGFAAVETHHDLSGRPRVTRGRHWHSNPEDHP